MHERAGAPITVVLDPVDGSTNCSRGISYWATSICALDADGPLAALVVNQATGSRARRRSAARARPRRRRAARVDTSTRVEDVGDRARRLPDRAAAVEAVPRARLRGARAVRRRGGRPRRATSTPGWSTRRGTISAATSRASKRARRCATRTATQLVTDDPTARRQIVAAGTPELADIAAAGRRRERISISTRCSSAADRGRDCRRRDRRARTSARRPTSARRRPATGSARPTSRARTRSARARRARPGSRCSARRRAATRADTGWLVDPLDGTANFVHGFDAVGVSVGLVAGRRARRRRRARAAARPHATAARARVAARSATSGRSHVSGRAPEQAIVATGFPFRRKDLLPGYEPAFDAAIHRFEDLRRVGGREPRPVLDRRGRVRRLLRAAARPVGRRRRGAHRAGGRRVVTDWTGDDAAWLGSGNILAAPPAVHAALLEEAAAAGSAPS